MPAVVIAGRPQVVLYDADGNAIVDDGRVAVQNYDPETGTYGYISLAGSVKAAEVNRLVGSNHLGVALDSDDWTTAHVGSGSHSVANALLTLSTGATANSTALVRSIHKGTFVSGTTNLFATGIRIPDEGVANCVRRWGCYDANNGLFFELNGTTFRICVRNNGVDTYVDSGSFNGNHGTTLAYGTNFRVCAIEYNAGTARFFVDRKLLHRHTATTSSTVGDLDLKVTTEVFTQNGLASNLSVVQRGCSLIRLGEIDTVRIGETLNDTFIAQVTKSVLAAKKPDGTFINIEATADGRLLTSGTAPSPTASTTVKRVVFGDVTANNTSDDVYTITSGKSLTVQTMLGGGSDTTAGGRIELHVRDNSGVTPSVNTLVVAGYVAGGNFSFDVDENFTGDGSRQVILRRVNLGGATMHMFGRWKGYEV